MFLTEYKEEHRKYVEEYFIADDYFTADPKSVISDCVVNPTSHAVLCFLPLSDDLFRLVTFFVLDETCASYSIDGFGDTDLLLRDFSTDSNHLRKGYAKESMVLLPDFVKWRFPNVSRIVLCVNERNVSAMKLYEQAGFVRTEQVVEEPKGLAFVYERVLSS